MIPEMIKWPYWISKWFGGHIGSLNDLAAVLDQEMVCRPKWISKFCCGHIGSGNDLTAILDQGMVWRPYWIRKWLKQSFWIRKWFGDHIGSGNGLAAILDQEMVSWPYWICKWFGGHFGSSNDLGGLLDHQVIWRPNWICKWFIAANQEMFLLWSSRFPLIASPFLDFAFLSSTRTLQKSEIVKHLIFCKVWLYCKSVRLKSRPSFLERIQNQL